MENARADTLDDQEMELTQRLCHALEPNDLSCAENGQVYMSVQSTSSHPALVWKTHPIDVFSSQLSGEKVELKKASKAVKKFYRKQDAHIRELEKLTLIEESRKADDDDSTVPGSDRPPKRASKATSLIIRIVFFANLLLLIGKAVAAAISGSLSVIFSLLDSCVDLASGGIMWYTARQMRKRRPYSYPQGRTRLEPIAVIVLAVFMGSISVQLLIQSVETIVRMSRYEKGPPNMTALALGIMAITIVVKLALYIMCYKFKKSPAVGALMVDQRNDVFSNCASLLFSGIASRLQRFEQLKFLDPIGALLIGIYIIYSWYKIGAEQTRKLAGYTADPKFIQKIAFVCLNHDAAIEKLDTIRAFHFGSHFLVEVDIVLPHGMCLKEAHDIGEDLQKKLERVEGVERAFVHLDYESLHHPESEHKIA